MDEPEKPPPANPLPPAFRRTLPTPGMEPPEPESEYSNLHRREPVVDSAGPSNDLPGPPRWKKILGALFRVSTVAVPGAGAGYVAAHVQTMPQTHQAPASLLLTRSEDGQKLDSANIDRLVPLVVVIVQEDNTEAKRAEAKSILEQGVEVIKSLPGQVLLDTVKDAVKDAAKVTLVGAPMMVLARFLLRRSRESGNKLIGWLGGAAEKIANLFGKHEAAGAITTEQLSRMFGGEKMLAAETLLLIAGYRKQGDTWSRSA
jgi:hypothetical protein